jgi:hypothetical protein
LEIGDRIGQRFDAITGVLKVIAQAFQSKAGDNAVGQSRSLGGCVRTLLRRFCEQA